MSHATQAGLELLILLPLPPKYGNSKAVPPCLGFHLPVDIIVLYRGRQGEEQGSERTEPSFQQGLFPRQKTRAGSRYPYICPVQVWLPGPFLSERWLYSESPALSLVPSPPAAALDQRLSRDGSSAQARSSALGTGMCANQMHKHLGTTEDSWVHNRLKEQH